MYVKKFEGETLDAALKAVKSELGPDAIILKTVTNKGLKGAFKKNRIEITAAISEDSYAKKARVDHVLTEDQRSDFYNTPAKSIKNSINNYDKNSVRPAQGFGYGKMGLNKVVKTVSLASDKIKNSLDDFLTVEQGPHNRQPESSLGEFLNGNDDEISDVSRFEQDELVHAESAHTEQIARNNEMIQESNRENHEVSNELKQEIKSQKHKIDLLEQKLFELSQKISEGYSDSKSNSGITNLVHTLKSLDLNDKIIQKITKKANFELTPEELDDADLLDDFALRELSGLINTEMPLFSKADIQESPVVTVLISENSCGQSSMALKLAVLQENVKIIRFREQPVDTVDTDFITQVFKLDLSTVNSLSHLMSEARKAIEEGRSIILDLRLNFKESNESKKFIETLKRSFEKVEFLTTISAIQSEVYNRKTISKYKPFCNGVIISYIDQCLSFGSLLNLHSEFRELPLKFYGTGATIPDDMEAATAERLLAGMFKLN